MNLGYPFEERWAERVVCAFGGEAEGCACRVPAGHSGVDWAVPPGETVFAAAAGLAARCGYDPAGGWFVVLDHLDGWETCYAGLGWLQVEACRSLRAGQPLGRSAGRFHFGVRRRGALGPWQGFVDPLPFLAWGGSAA